MGILHFLGEHWFDAFQCAGIVASLLFTAVSFRSDEKMRRITNLLTITEHHRSIWTACYQHPELSRVFDPKADIVVAPVTDEEFLFSKLLIVHLFSGFRAMKDGMILKPEGVCKDTKRFFSLPIPQAAWERYKTFQDSDFVEFVEACRK